MPRQPVFAGLIVDEYEQAVEVAYIGDEPCYVVNDAGFRRHIPSEQVDRQVLKLLGDSVEGNEGLLSEQTAKLMGQDDIFSRAMIEAQLKNIDQQFENLLQMGLPEELRAYMGMLGFRIRINLHGEVLDINQPGAIDPEDES
ncbi:MAG: hypothetical protein JXB15_13775 [Anaerolineales bacterium]|nr:hypothetical protein [Anaerolineales bacterium]